MRKEGERNGRRKGGEINHEPIKIESVRGQTDSKDLFSFIST